MDVRHIRNIAQSVGNVEEISANQNSRVISFINTAWECRINVYYTTGTVGTCLNHPCAGKTQLFRRNVGYDLLKKIFEDPRVHTGVGYYRTDTAPSRARSKEVAQKVSYEEAGDEETEIRRQLEILQPQVDLLREQLNVLAAQRLAAAEEAGQRDRERTRQQEEVRRREAEERVRMRQREAEARERAEEEQRRVAEAEERAAQARREVAARSRLVNARGNNYDYRLRWTDLFPQSMSNVVSVAISNGGYVAVYEGGSCSYHGINSELAAALDRQQLSHIAYVAAGPAGQYYIRKTNGKELRYGSYEFMEAIDNARSGARLVALGDFDTFFIEFLDGSRTWSRDLDDLVGEGPFEYLRSADLDTVWLGSERHFDYAGYHTEERIGYYIGYSNGGCTYAYLPDGVQQWLTEKRPSVKVKQVLADERDNYFIRYS